MKFWLILALTLLSFSPAHAAEACSHCGVWEPYDAAEFFAVTRDDKLVITPDKITFPGCAPVDYQVTVQGNITLSTPPICRSVYDANALTLSLIQNGMEDSLDVSYGTASPPFLLRAVTSVSTYCDQGSGYGMEVCFSRDALLQQTEHNNAFKILAEKLSFGQQPIAAETEHKWVANLKRGCRNGLDEQSQFQGLIYFQCLLPQYAQRITALNAVAQCHIEQKADCPVLASDMRFDD